MDLFAFRVLYSFVVFLMVGWMVWDQRRAGTMYRYKWGVAALLVAVLLLSGWTM